MTVALLALLLLAPTIVGACAALLGPPRSAYGTSAVAALVAALAVGAATNTGDSGYALALVGGLAVAAGSGVLALLAVSVTVALRGEPGTRD